jgi:hypothetical protein
MIVEPGRVEVSGIGPAFHYRVGTCRGIFCYGKRYTMVCLAVDNTKPDPELSSEPTAGVTRASPHSNVH